jgi:8-oxo-dGTP pyrophosphatase MutT (NUDIX family)
MKTTNKIFYIPVGGGIEFGEHSSEAAKREVMEEIGEEIINLRLMNIMENIFTYNGINEHEIVFIYIADLKNKDAYHSLVANKNNNGESIKLTWASVEDLKIKSINVYPFQLLKLLEKIST